MSSLLNNCEQQVEVASIVELCTSDRLGIEGSALNYNEINAIWKDLSL